MPLPYDLARAREWRAVADAALAATGGWADLLADGQAAWLARRFAEREVFRAGEKTRAAAMRQLASTNRPLQDVIKLVIAARATAVAVNETAADTTAHTVGPRLFGGAAG